MRKGGGKSKGSAHERKVCQWLSLWVSHGKAKDLFWRSAISGGRSTQAHKRGEKLRRQAGDICSVSAEGCVLTDKFFIECKHYKDLDIAAFCINRRGKLATFWRKAIKEAKKYDKYPLLIAKQNFMPEIVITQRRMGVQPIAVLPSHLGNWAVLSRLSDILKTSPEEVL